MNDIKHFILFLFLLLATNSNAHGSFSFSSKDKFDLIENNIDTTKLKFIKTIKGTCYNKESSMIQLYNSLRDKAFYLGANSYKFKNKSIIDSNNTIEIYIDTYWISDSLKKINDSYHEKNAIYIFGSDLSSKSITFFSFNNIKMALLSGSYFKYVGKIGDKVNINKGGILGSTYTINYKEDRSSIFLTFKGLQFSDATYPTMGIGITTGSILFLDDCMGRFLVLLLKEKI
ncbi:MAG: hypothetical protein WC599_11610 [Bacteroidales bacterium]